MKLLGKDRIMGLAVGNEMDNVDNERQVQPDFWESGFFNLIKSIVDDMDAAGFTDIPVTVVWSMGALAQQPFNSKIMSLVTQARDTWGNRWVWSFNPYPLWDTNLIPTSAEDCDTKVANSIAIDYTRNVMGDARNRVAQFVANNDYALWVTESGWSSPAVDPQIEIVEFCPSWADKESAYTFYQNMMEWDLSLPDADGVDGHGVDHMFYFTMRDAGNGFPEHFGLINGCEDTTCKIDDTPTHVFALV
jgi:predicted enzyme related to lactoylglutathione lyase